MNISKFEDYDDDYDVARDELFSNPNAFIGRSSINKIPENYSVIGRDYAFDDSGVVNQILNIMKKIYKDGLTLSKVKLDLNLSHISI